MGKRVNVFEDANGKRWDTERECDAADARIAIEEWVYTNATSKDAGDPCVNADAITKNAADLLPLLRKYVRLSAPEKDDGPANG